MIPVVVRDAEDRVVDRANVGVRNGKIYIADMIGRTIVLDEQIWPAIVEEVQRLRQEQREGQR